MNMPYNLKNRFLRESKLKEGKIVTFTCDAICDLVPFVQDVLSGL